MSAANAMTDTIEGPRLFLITPAATDAATFPRLLADTLAAADVAAVLIADAANAAALVPVAQNAGAAALLPDDTRLAGRLKADGVHVGSGLGDLRLASESFRPQRIVGAGNIHSRHAAMEAGEIGVDYLFFGRPYGDTHDAPHPKALDLAEWWSELMEVPAVIMAGCALASVADAAATGAAFVALHDAVWSHAEGPSAAMRQAAALLTQRGRQAA
jgi:thiamine-phosphate pyrophosphorylase